MAKISINLKEGAIKKDENIVVGIDLGTTNSLVAYVQEDKALAVKGKDGKNTLVPSIIHFDKQDVIVGDKAKLMLVEDPEHTIYSVKRLLGKSYEDIEAYQQNLGYRIIDQDDDALVKIEVDGTYHSPISLSAEILKYLKKRIEEELNQEIQKVVITVPAYFNDSQRQATRDAGKLAGLEVLRIVNEPTAAALAYGIGLSQEEEKTVAVYDLGGGTFDVSILNISGGIFDVISTNGDTFLGGDDFDKKIIEFWKSRYFSTREDFYTDKSFYQSIRIQAEKAKKMLSTSSKFTTKIGNQEIQLTIDEFDDMIRGLVERTIESCKMAMEDAGLSPKDIDEVIMVGGSTRVPLVRKSVGNFFEQNIHIDLNPDEVVALGAAVQANVLAGKQEGVLLLDITPLSLGIETMGGLMDVIISRNTKIPASLAREYTTSVDGQKNLKIGVYQGERDLVEHNRKLGEFILSNIPSMPAGIPKIQIQFILDADGILVVKAKELRSEVEQSITIKSQYGISEEEMAKMLLDSIKNAKSDMTVKALKEAVNEGNNIVVNSERFLRQHSSWLSDEQKNKMSSLLGELKEQLKGENKDLINQAMTRLNDYSAPIAHEAMDRVIQSSLGGKSVDKIDT